MIHHCHHCNFLMIMLLSMTELVCQFPCCRRSSESVLGETADPNELLYVEDCMNISVACIECKVNVTYYEAPQNWAMLGGELVEYPACNDEKTYWYQKR
jgi:hypothetical protein